ncbi:DUF4198 domain-containing protein [Erythrobacter sp.]|jgi:hypothetical protein|uniref:DUF4198 domain-containing protein n=1 Tax=Erythrobacter sp. TaxID=1042 RepID=UPI002EA5BD92|nr:DUF4198 domain-containing protein [Erythrobacter sp.]
MIRPTSFLRIFVLLALLLPSAAAAHSFWLQPVDHTPEAGEEVRIEFKVGDAGDVNDWGLYWERIAALRLFGPDGVSDQQRGIRVTAGEEPGSALIAVAKPGTHILAFASNPSFSDLEAERFDRYVEHEGLSAIAQHRAALGQGRGNGKELYARRAKTLLQVGDAHTDNATRPIGQTLEIVPLTNPFALDPGAPLKLQILWRGEPLAGAQLLAAPLDATGDYESFRSDANGMVKAPAPVGAAMLYSAVWGVPAPNDARADYFTIFASLTVGTR